MPDLAVPNGCRWCGTDRQIHAQRWHPDAGENGWHGWTAPTNEQRLARIRARREARRG